jgi:hypothetical protein
MKTQKEAVMADRVLFIGWNRAIPGREKQGLEMFGRAQQYYAKLVADKRIESFDIVLLGAHGGDLNGFVLLKGNARQIAEVREDSPFIELMIEAGYCTEGVGEIRGVINEGMADWMTPYMKLVG